MKTIAIMQPYFVPYAGYFRLLEQADVFVIYDCVQFPRRGYVHRNQLPNAQGVAEWLTLPIEKCARDTTICDLRFPKDAAARLRAQLASFPQLHARDRVGNPLIEYLLHLEQSPVDYLSELLKLTAAHLSLETEFLRSSTLKLSPELRGQERILHIAKLLDATRYVNAPGGRDLYDEESFAAQGVDLVFLDDYTGERASILHRVCTEPVSTIIKDIRVS